MKPITAWAIKSKDGGILILTIRLTRRAAINSVLSEPIANPGEWELIAKHGYRAVKVRIEEEEEG